MSSASEASFSVTALSPSLSPNPKGLASNGTGSRVPEPVPVQQLSSGFPNFLGVLSQARYLNHTHSNIRVILNVSHTLINESSALNLIHLTSYTIKSRVQLITLNKSIPRWLEVLPLQYLNPHLTLTHNERLRNV